MGFSVSNGQIIGPNGQPFIAGGVDIWAGQVINDPTGSANLIASLFPNANMVRIAAGDGYAADTAAALTPFVNLMTSKGIVVEIGNYNPALTSNVGSGQALTDELAWFTSLATAFKGNPYVWFSTDNEPSDQFTYGGATSAEQLAVYNAIRATGSTSMIGLENSQWSMNGQQSFSASISASDIAGMTNVHWDDHYYNWLSNYSTSVSDNLTALQAEVAGSQVYKDANGVIPVIVGEYGNSTTGTGIDGGGTATIAAVLESGYGSTAWGINPGGTGDQLTNGNSLTAFGQQVATAETSPVVAPPPPPPLLPPSPNGTTTTTASGSPIVDAAGRSWTLVQSASQGLQTAINGTVDTTTANVVLLETLNGNMIQENTAGNWSSEPGTGGAWTQIAAPVAPPAPSASGTEITTASASPIIDQSGNAWTLVQSASNGLQIAVNGTVDATHRQRHAARNPQRRNGPGEFRRQLVLRDHAERLMGADCESEPTAASATAGDHRHRKWLGYAGAEHLGGCLRQRRRHQRRQRGRRVHRLGRRQAARRHLLRHRVAFRGRQPELHLQG